MALIKCPECGHEISDKAASCPGCGCPTTEPVELEEIKEKQIKRVFNESETSLRIDLGKNSYIEIRGDIMKINSTTRDVTDYISNFVLLYDKNTFGVPCVRFTHDALYTPIRLEPLWGNKNIDKIRELSNILREKAIVNEKGMIRSANYRTDAQKERFKKIYEQKSDKAGSCPGCGCPSSEFETSKSEVDIFVKEVKRIHEKNQDSKVCAIKELRQYSGFGLSEAKVIMDMEYGGENIINIVQSYIERKNLRNEKKKNDEEKRKRKEEIKSNKGHPFLDFCDEVAANARTVCCPKCHSTSISYDTKKLSIGRALVGDAIAGPAGAVLGGLTSKKGYAVCLNCGKRWKIK